MSGLVVALLPVPLAKEPKMVNVRQFFRSGYRTHKIGVKEDSKMFHGVANNHDDLPTHVHVIE